MIREFFRMLFCVESALALCRCGESPDASDDTDSSAGIIITDVEATLSDAVSTVVVVQWKTNIPGVGRVEFGTDETFAYSTPMETESTEAHRALLLGMKADTTVYYRIAVKDGADEVMTDTAAVTTGNLPSYLPDLTVEGQGPDGFNLVPIIGTEAVAVTIIDKDGRIVWYRRDDRGLDVYRARLSRDGRSILYNAASISGELAENSEIVRVSLDGEEVSGIPVPLLAHDFVELKDGTIGAMTSEYRDFNGTDLMGSQIVEVSSDGTVTPVWSAWDCFDPETDPGDDMSNGWWTFANALDYDAAEDVYYLGFRNFSSIVKIDRQSGECLWVFGSTAETISFASGASRFLHQHQFQILEDGILVFDNDGAAGTESRVIEYAFDFDTSTASEIWSYTADPTVYTFVLGEPTRLDDGNTFINWSASGQMNLVTTEGESLFQLNTPMGDVFGFNTLVTSLY